MKLYRDKHQVRLLTPAVLLLFIALNVIEQGWMHHLLLLVTIFLSAVALVRSIRENRTDQKKQTQTNEFEL